MTASTIKPAQSKQNHTDIKSADNTGNCIDSHIDYGAILMLASSNLPIGSYTYSQGVETAIEVGLIKDEASALAWLQDYLQLALFGFELPLLLAHFSLLQQGEVEIADAVAEHYMASRESHEFTLEASQLAHALKAWVEAVLALSVPATISEQGFLPLFVHICHYAKLTAQATAIAYAFGQLENMVLATVKTVPLGQMAGQRILWQLQSELQATINQLVIQVNNSVNFWLTQDSISSPIDSPINMANTLLTELCNAGSLPNLAILSSQHETQYSRLFRS